MLAVFCLRLAAGMIACLLLLPTAHVNPRFFRTHCLTALGLACVALLMVRGLADWPLFVCLGLAMFLAFAGSFVWSLEGAPLGRGLIILLASTLITGLVLLERQAAGPLSMATVLPGAITSAAVLGTSLTAMLMGHMYLIAPSMSLSPLMRLLGAAALAVLARAGVDGWSLAQWTNAHSFSSLGNDTLLWLPVRWLVGFMLPLVLTWMAWQSAKIRSTQSATGILYVAVIFCFLGELTSLLLRESRLVM